MENIQLSSGTFFFSWIAYGEQILWVADQKNWFLYNTYVR